MKEWKSPQRVYICRWSGWRKWSLHGREMERDICVTVMEEMTMNKLAEGALIVLAVWVLSRHSSPWEVGRGSLSKLWCGTGDWGKCKGHVEEEGNRGNKPEMGGMTWEGSHQATPVGGIARRLLIRTQANEVQGHWIYRNALNNLPNSWYFTIKSKLTSCPWSH